MEKNAIFSDDFLVQQQRSQMFWEVSDFMLLDIFS